MKGESKQVQVERNATRVGLGRASAKSGHDLFWADSDLLM